MCFGGSTSTYQTTTTPTVLPEAPVVQAPEKIQAGPAKATPTTPETLKRKGKRGLVIPLTSGINIPGA